jgi:hypothetical protein
MPKKIRDGLISPAEMGRMLGKNPAPIYEALQRGTYPIGMAYRTKTGRWVYDVPRKPFEEFVRTGKMPG